MATYTIPAHVMREVRGMGYPDSAAEMRGHIETWNGLFRAEGDFWDYNSKEGGVTRCVHRRTVHPAKKVAREWASLLMNERTASACEDAACTEWLEGYYARTGFYSKGQGLVARAFALGTAAWALRLDLDAGEVFVDRYDARMVLPLSWDEDGVRECAFASRVYDRGAAYDQLVMHVVENGTYHIKTMLWDEDGDVVQAEGVEDDFDTLGDVPWFSIVRPAGDNTLVDFSPYGQSVYADAADALKSVDLCYDAIMNEVDLAKLRIFIGDMLIDYTTTDEAGNTVRRQSPLPFGQDNTVFRKVISNEDVIKEFAPSMRTDAQMAAYKAALAEVGSACGLGEDYFTLDERGGLKTATEVASDSSKLMRHIREHSHLLAGSVAAVGHALLHCARTFLGESLPDEGNIDVQFDDSIITDTEADKRMALAEIGALGIDRLKADYLVRFHGYSEEEALALIPQRTVIDEGF